MLLHKNYSSPFVEQMTGVESDDVTASNSFLEEVDRIMGPEKKIPERKIREKKIPERKIPERKSPERKDL